MQKPSEIVCRYFLDAVENSRYGWKWICPNGMTCHYRHCLPPGFVFKTKKTLADVDSDDAIALEEQLEEEKRKLDFSKGTPMTLERFQAWKAKKEKQKKKEEEAKKKE